MEQAQEPFEKMIKDLTRRRQWERLRMVFWAYGMWMETTNV